MQNNNDFELNNLIGTVISYDINTREIEAYIPKLSPKLYQNSKKEYKMETLSPRLKLANTISIDTLITHSNVIKLKAWDITERIPKIGSKVEITVFEDYIDKLYWNPIKSNDIIYEPIDEEKYEDVCTLNIGSRSIKLKSEDTVELLLPSIFEANIAIDSNNPKHKIITINENINQFNITTLKENIEFLNNNIEAATEMLKSSLLDSLSVSVNSLMLNEYTKYISEEVISAYNENNKEHILESTNFLSLKNIRDIIYKNNSIIKEYKELFDFHYVIDVSENNKIFKTLTEPVKNLTTKNLEEVSYYVKRISYLLRKTRRIILIGSIYEYDNVHDNSDNIIQNLELERDYNSNISGEISKYKANYDFNYENSNSILYSNGIFVDFYKSDTIFNDTTKFDGKVDKDYDLYPGFDIIDISYTGTTNENNTEIIYELSATPKFISKTYNITNLKIENTIIIIDENILDQSKITIAYIKTITGCNISIDNDYLDNISDEIKKYYTNNVIDFTIDDYFVSISKISVNNDDFVIFETSKVTPIRTYKKIIK